MEITSWLGQEFWGKGLAAQALHGLLNLGVAQPIFARPASDNSGSIRVLQKCDFKMIGRNRGFAHGSGELTKACLLRLDFDRKK